MERFRLTTWPLDRLPTHPIVVTETWRDGDLIRYLPGWAPELFADLPDEWVLRELPLLDLDDPDVVTSVVRDHGVISLPFTLMKPLTKDRPDPACADGECIWIEDAADYLRVARALVGHWQAGLAGDDPSPAWRQEGFRIRDEDTAYSYLRRALNYGLRAFAPRLDIVSRLQKPIAGLDDTWIEGRPVPGLYEGLTLQIFNLIYDGLPALECANSSCRGLFVRQQGRSKEDQRRTVGVKYCSKSCSNSVAQREYRRRQSKKSRNRSGGE